MWNTVPLLAALSVAAITPGPNNLIVLEAGTRGGLRAAVPLVTGVVAGSLILLLAVWLGLAGVLKSFPHATAVTAVLAAAYLCWLATRLWSCGASIVAEPANARTVSPVWIAAQQWVNPKAWVFVMTVAAVGAPLGIPTVVAATAIVTSVCLIAWAVAGARLLHRLRGPHARRTFNRALAILLITSALGILHDALR